MDQPPFNEKEIKSFRRKNVSVKQFLEICSHFDDPFAGRITAENLYKMENGSFLGIHSLDNGKTFKRLHLKTIWFKPYSLSYRTTKTKNGKGREGKELLISSMPLPRGPVVLG